MKWLKVGAVIFGAVAITALGIDAADTLQGSRSTLLGQVISVEEGGCPDGMVPVDIGASFSCVDTYEASTSDECKNDNPKNEQQSQENINTVDCKAVSQPDVLPWRFITREQAQAACLRAGKRLPNSEEWYLFSAGTPDTKASCNIETNGVKQTGENQQCISGLGVFDAIGNIWEWTSDDVIEGTFNGRQLPETGYVAQVDSSGIATVTETKGSDIFSKDYFWSDSRGAYGILRGGFYNSHEDAGVYAVHAQTLPTSAGTAIGFRCVK